VARSGVFSSVHCALADADVVSAAVSATVPVNVTWVTDGGKSPHCGAKWKLGTTEMLPSSSAEPPASQDRCFLMFLRSGAPALLVPLRTEAGATTP